MNGVPVTLFMPELYMSNVPNDIRVVTSPRAPTCLACLSPALRPYPCSPWPTTWRSDRGADYVLGFHIWVRRLGMHMTGTAGAAKNEIGFQAISQNVSITSLHFVIICNVLEAESLNDFADMFSDAE